MYECMMDTERHSYNGRAYGQSGLAVYLTIKDKIDHDIICMDEDEIRALYIFLTSNFSHLFKDEKGNPL